MSTLNNIELALPRRGQIDWALLREQKAWLITNGSDSAIGLTHLVDTIQDDAVATQGFSNYEVFGDLPD